MLRSIQTSADVLLSDEGPSLEMLDHAYSRNTSTFDISISISTLPTQRYYIVLIIAFQLQK